MNKPVLYNIDSLNTTYGSEERGERGLPQLSTESVTEAASGLTYMGVTLVRLAGSPFVPPTMTSQ